MFTSRFSRGQFVLLCGLLTACTATMLPAASPVVLPGRSVAREPAVFDAIDTNKDGKVSEAEFVNYELRRRFAAVDADKDGRLSRKEYVASIKNGVGELQADIDWKLINGGKEYITLKDLLRHDGTKKLLSAEFQKIDQNGDGHITMTEWSKGKHPAKRSAAGK